jgi:two-component system response regulator NreC
MVEKEKDWGTKMISIVLADDHGIVRQGLWALLDAEPDFNIVGEATDGNEAARLAELLQPHVLVTDLMMGSTNGFEVVRQVNRRSPKTNVVIFSMYGNEAYVLEALRAGAKAYVLKESASEELINGIRHAAAGQHYLSSPLSERAIEGYIQKTEATALDPYDTLTTREREVLHLVAQGTTSTEIAAKLYLSRRTVETHRANLMRKLGLHSRAELLRYALQRAILPLSDTYSATVTEDSSYQIGLPGLDT